MSYTFEVEVGPIRTMTSEEDNVIPPWFVLRLPIHQTISQHAFFALDI